MTRSHIEACIVKAKKELLQVATIEDTEMAITEACKLHIKIIRLEKTKTKGGD